MHITVAALLMICLFQQVTTDGSMNELEVDAAVTVLIDSVMVPAHEAGPLVEVATREGQRVKPGDLLVRIDDQDVVLDLARAQLALEHALEQASNDVKLRLANQGLKVAQLELRNAEEANKELAKVVSDSQIQKLRIAVENAQLQVEQATKDLATAKRAALIAENDLRIAQRNVARRRLVSPTAGLVVEVRRQKGEWVQPGDTVARIVRDDRLRVEGFVLANNIPETLLGRSVEVTYGASSESPRKIIGQVVFVSPEVNPINGQVRVWAEVENGDGRLRAGLPVRMVISSAAATGRP